MLRWGPPEGKLRRWRRDIRDLNRSALELRNSHVDLAGRTLEFVAGPKPVAGNSLVAVGAEKFKFSHNIGRRIAGFCFSSPNNFYGAGVSFA